MYTNKAMDKMSTLPEQVDLGNGSQSEQWKFRDLCNRFARGQLTSEEMEALR